MDEKKKPQPDAARKSRVAIVGTGLAGLTTAYLLQNDQKQRYEVTLFEQVKRSRQPFDDVASPC